MKMEEIDIGDNGDQHYEQDIPFESLKPLEPQMNRTLFPLFPYETKAINDLHELKYGDVASFPYYGFNHWGIVTEVKFENDPKQGKMRCIHYSTPSISGTREVAEELFPINLKKSKVGRLQLNVLDTFAPQQVVVRARKRVGEKKWNIDSNRSDHLCVWAKVKTGQISEGRKCPSESERGTEHSANLSCLLIGKADVHLIDEIQPGDIVEYESDTGIIVKMQDINEGRRFNIDVVTLKDLFPSIGRCVSYKIDLNKDHLVVHKYHPERCVSMQQRVKRAINMIDKESQRWTQAGFIKDIILQPRVSRALLFPIQCDMIEIKDLSEMKIGDVVSITYYAKDHLIIISDVEFKDDLKRGKVRGIHYALPRFFDDRVVAEDHFELNLEKSKITRLQLDMFNTFPSNEVVYRARKRIGEKKWHFSSNRSKHLCLWAKVKTVHLSEENPQIERRNESLGGLTIAEKVSVHLMDEIQLGDVVKYKSDRGIIVKLVDTKEGRIFDMDVVVLRCVFPSYGRCVSHRINLNKDHLRVYRYNPAQCVSMKERTQRALQMIDEESPRWTHNAFIEHIIRKPKDHN